MSAQIISGKAIARQIEEEIRGRAAARSAAGHQIPSLVAVLVGSDPASEVYVKGKQRACERVGLAGRLIQLPADTPEAELLAWVAGLNEDRQTHGILVQLPLPPGIDTMRVLDAVHSLKDVDCFHPQNVGLLMQGRPRFLPCTPHGVMQMLHRSGIPVEGRHVAIVGRSEIVGKPLAAMLVQRDSPLGPSAANATVTICHSKTRNLAEITRAADVIVAAVGRAGFITAEMVRPGAAVIDVGINRTSDGLRGDVDFAAVQQVAGHLTPVPGGVGPLTITMLMQNTLLAAELLEKGTGA